MWQPRSSGRSDAKRRALLCVLAVVLTGRMAPARAADRDLLLAVVLNARPLDTLVEVRESGGEIFVQTDDFPAIGLASPIKRSRKGEPKIKEITLSRVHGLTYRVDEPRQMLLIQADDQALSRQIIGSPGTDRRPDPSGFGLLLDYDVSGSFGGTRDVAGLFTTQLNLPVGYLSSGLLVNSQLAEPAVRLSSSFTYQDWDGERNWTIGDVLSGGLSWTRPFRLGGVQVQSAFDMRPDVVTTPNPGAQRPRRRTVHGGCAGERRARI